MDKEKIIQAICSARSYLTEGYRVTAQNYFGKKEQEFVRDSIRHSLEHLDWLVGFLEKKEKCLKNHTDIVLTG